MAVEQMKRISIYSFKKNRKNILEEIQRKGIIQIENLDIEDSVFNKETTTQKQAVFLKNASIAENAFCTLKQYKPQKSSILNTFKGREPISVEDYYQYTEDAEEIMHVAYDILSLEKRIADNKADIIRLESQIESLLPWVNLDLSMRFKGTKNTAAFIGTLPQQMTYEDIVTALAQRNEKLNEYTLELISTSQNQTCIFFLCSESQQESAAETLRLIGFSKPAVNSKELPKDRIEILKQRIKNCESDIEKAESTICGYNGFQNALKFISDYYVMRCEKYTVIDRLVNTKKTFILTGYIPARATEQIERILCDKYEAAVEIEDITQGESPPVLLKNPRLTAPVEGVLESYSLPNKGEVDPTSVMAIFYYVFFGMMFSDAGYGILMFLGCAALLLKFKHMESGLKKSIKMFMYCGISTTFWGFMFGSFFGDAVTVIGNTFFNADVSIMPLWFDPVSGSNSMTLLMVCFLFGIIHLFVGLGMKAYMLIKERKFLDVIYDVISWYLLVGGGILALLSMEMLSSMTGFTLPPVCMTIGGVCAGVGAVIVLFFEGRGSSPIKRFLKGAYGLYGVTGYLSDILSYSRLLALGLATGVIAQVFNQIASMFGGGILGAILFTVVFIIGHALNMGINALGAYVHTNRLQFVEFFGKFYEGGGVKFSPFAIKTKYFKIKEEIFNG